MSFLDKVKEVFSGNTKQAVDHQGIEDNPVALSADEQDHSDPNIFRGEDAEAPVNEGGLHN